MADKPARTVVPLVALSDAELGAVTGPDAPAGRLVLLPGLDGLPGAERATALEAARQSLRDRGLIDERGAPTEVLAALLAIRARPRMITVAERVANGVTTNRYLYGTVLPEAGDAVLEEDLDTGGVHRFTLRTQAGAGEHLAGFVDPDAQARRDGPPRIARAAEPPKSWEDVHEALSGAQVVTRLFSTRKPTHDETDDSEAADDTDLPERKPEPGGPRSRRVSMISGPSGVVMVAGFVPDLHGQEVEDGPVVFAQFLSRESLEILLRAFIHPTW